MTTEALKALDAAIQSIENGQPYIALSHLNYVHAALEATQKPVSITPVAWIHSFPGCNKLTFVEPADGEKKTPLYTLSAIEQEAK